MSTNPSPGPGGLLLADKPAGITSHNLVSRARRLYGTRRVGHAGTLDPMATGLLILGVDACTRLLTFLVGQDKQYRATIRLGQATITDDAEGEAISTAVPEQLAALHRTDIEHAAAAFVGEIEQVPSAVSAIKVHGERSYARVRRGEDVRLESRRVHVERFDLGEPRAGGDAAVRWIDVDAVVDCSSGTYVRALARDLGAALGVGGHLTALRRTRVGPFGIEEAVALPERGSQEPAPELLTPLDAARRFLRVRDLDAAEAEHLAHGRGIARTTDVDDEPVAAAFAGNLVAVVRNRGDRARPALVMPTANSGREGDAA